MATGDEKIKLRVPYPDIEIAAGAGDEERAGGGDLGRLRLPAPDIPTNVPAAGDEGEGREAGMLKVPYPSILVSDIATGGDEEYKHFDWPLTGRLRTDVDPLLLGEGDFQELKNFRYTATGIRGVPGMTATNSVATAYLSVSNGFHFKKDQPTENHIIAQTTTGANSRLVKVTTPTIPSVGDDTTYVAWQTLTDNSQVYFSKAPDNCMMAMDGNVNYVWGGTEYRCARFINFHPNYSFWYDYTDKVNNTLTTAANIATLKRVAGGNDANVMTLLHFEDNVTDSGSLVHGWTADNMTYSETVYKMGSHGAIFNGANGRVRLTAGDDPHFDFSGGTWTIDTWVRVDSLAAVNPIYYQNTDADHYFSLHIETTGAVHLQVYDNPDDIITLSTAAGLIAIDTWYHIAVVENADAFYIYVDGHLRASVSDTSRPANYTGTIYIGYNGTVYFDGYMDEFRISNSARWANPGFTLPTLPYGTDYETYLYVGSTRPLQGIKFYVTTPNATAATAKVFYWNGSGWAEVIAPFVDGTSSGGKTLAIDGTMTFSYSAGVAKAKVIRESLAYYYMVVFTAMDDNVTVETVTLDAPQQPIVDIWDGSPRSCAQFYKYTTSYTDYTVNVSDTDYDSAVSLTYAQLASLTSSQYLYLGFMERMQAINFLLPDSSYINTTAGTIMTVCYWNGSAWTSVGAVEDGTVTGGISMSQSGTVSWQGATENTEFPTCIANKMELYYYRINFSQTLSADVRTDYIYGIPAQKDVLPHRFAVEWQNRLWLCNEKSKDKNTALCASYGTVCVFNGSDSTRLPFGGADELVAGSTLFTRYSGDMYDSMVLFKRNEIYVVNGTTPADFRTFRVSDSVGCVAPLTLVKCDMSYEVAQGLAKHVLIWEGAGGIYAFDGNSVMKISRDIDDMFDSTSSTYVGNNCSTFSGGFDPVRLEYHWVTTSREMVYDLINKKWFEIPRGSGKSLMSLWPMMDAYGMQYMYGGGSDGYIHRLEYGTTFDGNGIAYSFRSGAVPLTGSAMYTTELRSLKLTAKAKTTSTDAVTLTWYGDGITSGTTLTTVSQTKAGYRIYDTSQNLSKTAMCHEIKCNVTISNETVGFEPLLLGGFYKVIKENM